MAAFSSGTINLKRKSVKAGKYEELDKAVFKWFCVYKIKKHTSDWLVLQEKGNDLTRTLDIVNFRSSYRWFDRWNARNNVKFKPVSSAGRKLIYQTYCQRINWRIFLTPMSLVFSFKYYQTKLWNWKGENVVVENTAKPDSPEWVQRVLQVKNYRYLSLERAKSEMLQERYVLAVSVQSTTKNMNGDKGLYRLDKTLESEITSSRP